MARRLPAQNAAVPADDPLPPEIADVTRRVSEAVASVAGVQAVVLGGSWAAGRASADSDVDLGVLYDAREPFAVADLRAVVGRLDDRGAAVDVTRFGAWGPFIDGGAWLTVDGRHVDLLYREIGRMRGAVADGTAGRVTTHYQPGHPHGFRSDIHLAELVACRPLHDPHDVVEELRAPLHPYPVALRAETVRANLWEAGFSIDVARGAARRADVHHVVGCLYRAATCAALAVLAHARTWCANEKGALRLADATGVAPDGFADRVEAVLAAPGDAPHALGRSLDVLASELAAIRAATAGDDGNDGGAPGVGAGT
jgi:predicted nucleotidyltransferase